MWNRCFSTCLVLLFLAGVTSAQKAIRTSPLSPIFSGVPGTPRVINNEQGRFWVVIWRQNGSPAAIHSRIVRSDGTLGASRILVSDVSQAVRSFDLIYLRKAGNYMLAYEAADGLYVQAFNKNFSRQGAPVAIQKGVRETLPQFLQNTSSNRVFLFWLADQPGSVRNLIRRVELQSNGRHSGAIQNLSMAPTGTTFETFSVAENSQNGIQFAIINQSGQPGGTKVLGQAFKLDGANVHPSPIVFQQFGSITNVLPDVSFSSTTGIAVWHSGGQIRYRFISPQGNLSGPARIISNAADPDSNPEVTFDSKKEIFVQTWTKGSNVFASAIDPVFSEHKAEFKSLAASAGNSLNANSSFNKAKGKSIVAWEEQSGNNYRIHATVFEVYSEEFVIEGKVKLRKDYKPPIVTKGSKYLTKFHVESGNKIFRAYLTPESEIIGSLPQKGDQIRMEYEPFRGRYRGYIESIEITSRQ